jgi:hypothetical protein
VANKALARKLAAWFWRVMGRCRHRRPSRCEQLDKTRCRQRTGRRIALSRCGSSLECAIVQVQLLRHATRTVFVGHADSTVPQLRRDPLATGQIAASAATTQRQLRSFAPPCLSSPSSPLSMSGCSATHVGSGGQRVELICCGYDDALRAVELVLANHVHGFDSRNDRGGAPEALEPEHWLGDALAAWFMLFVTPENWRASITYLARPSVGVSPRNEPRCFVYWPHGPWDPMGPPQ